MGNATRCPACNKFGTKDLGGYCKKCYKPDLDVKEEPTVMCSRCGEPSTRVNDEYEGCVAYPLCDVCYIDRFGDILQGDFQERNAPACVQCGEPAFKIADNNYPYCLRHYRDRMEAPIDPTRKHFREDFDIGNKPFWDDEFKIVKDNFDMEGKW